MNSESIFYIIAALAAAQLLLLIILHITGELQLTKQHLKTKAANKQGRLRKYQPTLSVVILHKQDSADITACLNSIYTNPYKITKVVIIDTSLSGNASALIRQYRKNQIVTNLHSYRLNPNRDNKGQTTKLFNQLIQKLTIVVDSAYLLQKQNIQSSVLLFKDKNITAIIPGQQLTVNNKLYLALFNITNILTNHFLRPFSNRKIRTISNQPALIVRTSAYKRTLTGGIIQTDIREILRSIYKRKSNHVVHTNQVSVYTNSVTKVAIPKVSILISAIFIALIGVSIYQMSIYNALPVIFAITLISIIFASVATAQKGIKITDRISLILIAPLSLFAAIVKPLLISKSKV